MDEIIMKSIVEQKRAKMKLEAQKQEIKNLKKTKAKKRASSGGGTTAMKISTETADESTFLLFP